MNCLSQGLGILTHCLDCQWVNDSSQSTLPPKGPIRGLTPLRTPQQMEEGKADKTRGKQPSSPFDRQLYWPNAFPHYIKTNHTYEAIVHSHLYNPHSPKTVLCQKVTIRSMDMHMDNSFHVSSIKKNDFFCVWPHASQHMKSYFPNQGSAPLCSGSEESQPLDCQGIPEMTVF